MKVYLITYHLAEEGTCLEYCATKKQASNRVRELKKEHSEELKSFRSKLPSSKGELVKMIDISIISFTPTRESIVEMLNRHTPSTDNG